MEFMTDASHMQRALMREIEAELKTTEKISVINPSEMFAKVAGKRETLFWVKALIDDIYQKREVVSSCWRANGYYK